MSFIIANGNSNDPSIYDTGVLPLSTEDVYSNGFTVQINANLTVNRLRNDAIDYYLPNTAIPIMTSNTTPSGTAISGGNGFGLDAWKAFDRTTTSSWQSNVANTGWVGYMFPTGKIIKRYSIYTAGSNVIHPRTWTFEGSNDGSSWTILDTQTLQSLVNATFYTYSVTNTTSFTYYRINITATSNITGLPTIAEFEMTESTSSVIGKITGGGFVISSINLTVNVFDLSAVATGLISITAASGTTRLNITSSVSAIAVANSTIINNSGNNNLIITCPSFVGATTNSAGIGNSTVLVKSGSGSLIMNGIVTGGGGNGGAGLNGINISGSGDVTITGDINARGTNNTNACYGVSHTGSGKLIVFNVNGAGSTTSTGYAILSTSTGNLEITGNVTGGGVAAAISKTTGAVIITGNMTGVTLPALIGSPSSVTCIGNINGGLSSAIQITGTGVIDVTGVVTAGSGSPGITSTGLVKLSGIADNTNRYSAIYAPQWTIELSTTSWKHQTFAGADITLYASGASLGNPPLDKVERGYAYGPSGTLIGTQDVPTAAQTLFGVPVRNTIGTLLMTPQAFWEQLTSGVSLPGSFGKLLKDFLDASVSSRASQASVNSIPTNPLLASDSRLNNLDATISSRNAITPPTVVAIRTEMDSNSTKLANLDAAVSSRMATFTYTAPDNASIIAIKLKTDTILWADIVNIKTKTDTIVWSDVTGLVSTTGDIKTKTDTIDWTDIVAIKAKTDTIDWGDVTSVTTSISELENGLANIPTNPLLDTDSRLDYLDAPVSGAGGSVDLQPVIDAVGEVPQLVLQEITDSPVAIAERLRNVSTVQTTGEQLASYTNS